MWLPVRNRLIAAGFHAFTFFLRVRRVITAIGRNRIVGIDHVTIPVHDLAVARDFYCRVLGAAHAMTIDADALERFGRPPAPDGGEGVFHLSVHLGGMTRLDLFLQSSGQAPPLQGHPHYAFRVAPGQLMAWQKKLEAQGVPTEGPLQLGFPGQASLYFNDPSGNHLELVSYGFGAVIPIRPPDLSRIQRTTPAIAR